VIRPVTIEGSQSPAAVARGKRDLLAAALRLGVDRRLEGDAPQGRLDPGDEEDGQPMHSGAGTGGTVVRKAFQTSITSRSRSGAVRDRQLRRGRSDTAISGSRGRVRGASSAWMPG
jgi:hypothetical protein